MIQIDMEMPKSCTECNFCLYVNSGISLHCSVVKKELHLYKGARSNNCPLREGK